MFLPRSKRILATQGQLTGLALAGMGSAASTPSREDCARDCARSVESGVAHLLESTRRETSSLCAELRAECVPDLSSAGSSLTRESALKLGQEVECYWCRCIRLH